jgi:hypothetical protein
MNLFESLREAREAGDWTMVRVIERTIARTSTDDLLHDTTKTETFEDTNLEEAFLNAALLDEVSLELEVAA